MSPATRKALAGIAVTAGLAVVAGVGALEWRFATGRGEVDREWAQASVSRPTDIGFTSKLEILPLVDWSTTGPQLHGEAGVSYLIRTDHNTILVDVGLNSGNRDPSPLLANMKQLGISLADIDTIVITHDHLDHVGGLKWARKGTFSLGSQQLDLGGKRVFVPVPMTYPGSTPIVSGTPTVIGPGVAGIGTIAGQLYMGRVEEQALAIRVKDKGVVVIVGCGHQGLSRLLERTDKLFDEPLYGLIGGLHYPVPAGRTVVAGIDVQRLVAFGPFRGPTAADVDREIASLASLMPEWVSLSPHDSSDESIEAFRRTFGARYHDLKVGEWMKLASP